MVHMIFFKPKSINLLEYIVQILGADLGPLVHADWETRAKVLIEELTNLQQSL